MARNFYSDIIFGSPTNTRTVLGRKYTVSLAQSTTIGRFVGVTIASTGIRTVSSGATRPIGVALATKSAGEVVDVAHQGVVQVEIASAEEVLAGDPLFVDLSTGRATTVSQVVGGMYAACGNALQASGGGSDRLVWIYLDISIVSSIPVHDHTSSSFQGGATLAPTTLTLPGATSPAQTAEGSIVWDTNDDILTIGDGSSRKTFGPLDRANTWTAQQNVERTTAGQTAFGVLLTGDTNPRVAIQAAGIKFGPGNAAVDTSMNRVEFSDGEGIFGMTTDALGFESRSTPSGNNPADTIVIYAKDEGSVAKLYSRDEDEKEWALMSLMCVTFTKAGTLTTGTGAFRWYASRSYVIEQVRASVNGAPTGSSILVDVNKNGTTIFTTQSNRPTIAVSTNTDLADAINVTTFASGDYLTADVDQIGSGTAGSDLTVQVWLRPV